MANQLANAMVILAGLVDPPTTDISTFINDSEYTRGAGVDNLTAYGDQDEVNEGAVRTGQFRMGGKYSTNASNTPVLLFDGSEGKTFFIIRRPQGTGVGKPQQKFAAVLNSYVETAAVAGHVMWTSQWTMSGAVNRAAQ